MGVRKAWSADAAIVSAVKTCNASPPAEAKGMTYRKWKSLTMLDPVVRAFTREVPAVHLKTRKDETISEISVSVADGSKVAFLSKTTHWNHKGKPKHDGLMAGKVWCGPVEVDESTGQRRCRSACRCSTGETVRIDRGGTEASRS